MRVLLIDVGGTSIGAFLLDIEERKSTDIGDILSPESSLEDRVIALANSICNKELVNKIFIGIPGDMNGCSDAVFCPPLNRSISIKSLRGSLSKAVIVNDTKVGALRACIGLSRDHIRSRQIVIVTLGTSIGLCTGPESFIETLDVQELTSHEFAHEKIINPERTSFYRQCLGSGPEYREKFFSIYSAGAFGRYLGLKTTGIEGEMIRIKKEELSRGLSCEPDLVKKVSTYMHSMLSDVKEYLDRVYGSGDSRFVVLGGLVAALRNAGFDFSRLEGNIDKIHFE